MPFMLAVMLELPIPAALARPPAAMVATVGEVEVQVTRLVRFAVLLSVLVPVAAN